MNKNTKYSPEVEERAVRLEEEVRKDCPSLWSAVESIAPKIGGAAVTLHPQRCRARQGGSHYLR